MDLNLDLGDFRYAAAFLVALGLGFYFTPMIREGAIRYGVVDRPDGKLKQHERPVAYLGGVAIYLSFLFAVAVTYEFTAQVLGLMLAASIVVMLGLFDDLKVLSPGAKLIGQLIAVLVLVKAGIMIRLTFLPDWAALLLTVFWLVGLTNALNLIDVSDGLAGGVACVAGVFLYIVSIWNGHTTIAMLTLALVGATCAFLAFNRAPASIYLGDTGSMFLGFMLGALAMSGHYTFKHRVAAVAPVILLGVPIFDTLYVMGVRAIRGIPLMQGSPDHFAVRLRRNGWSASAIATLSYSVAALLGGLSLILCVVSEKAAFAILLALAGATMLVVLGLWRLGRGPTRATEQADMEVNPLA
ncbi:MAG: MraY family glycosyltransferase [Myxococcota bacterium]